MSNLFELVEQLGRCGFVVEEVVEEPDGTLTARPVDASLETPEAGEVRTWKLSEGELEELRGRTKFVEPPRKLRREPSGTWLSCLNCRNHVFPDWALMPVGAQMTDTIRKPWRRRRVFEENGRLGWAEYSLTVWTDVRVVGSYVSLHGCLAAPPPSWEATRSGRGIYLLPRCCTNAVAWQVERGILVPLRGRPFMWDNRRGISVSRSWVEYEAMMERAEWCEYFAPWRGSKMDQPWRATLPARRAELKALRIRKQAFGRPGAGKSAASGRTV